MDWLDLLAVQGTLKSLLQPHSSKASILWLSALFTVSVETFKTECNSFQFSEGLLRACYALAKDAKEEKTPHSALHSDCCHPLRVNSPHFLRTGLLKWDGQLPSGTLGGFPSAW